MSKRVVAVVSADAPAVVEALFREYGEWVAEQLGRVGITFTEADLERHHDAFREEFPRLLGPRGRLLIARVDDEPVGVGALKPINEKTGEIKRMYVRPSAQGLGAGRAMLTRLVGDARAEGYTTVRLETLHLMTTAHAMYRAAGFVETPPFDGSETADSPLAPLTMFMELDLGVR
jgi:GNAT superfamily N-acetyltransferase